MAANGRTVRGAGPKKAPNYSSLVAVNPDSPLLEKPARERGYSPGAAWSARRWTQSRTSRGPV
jgi:hypothetical protein